MELLKDYLSGKNETNFGIILKNNIEDITVKKNSFFVDYEPNELIRSCSCDDFKGFIFLSNSGNISKLEKEISGIAAHVRKEDIEFYRHILNSNYLELWTCKPEKLKKCSYEFRKKLKFEYL